MTVQDFITAATYYVFVIPVLWYGYSQLSKADHDPRKSLFRILPIYFVTDAPPITETEAKVHQAILKVTRGLLVLPALFVVIAFSTALARWTLISPHMFGPLFVASVVPYTLLIFIHSIALERKAAERRFIVLKGLAIIGLMVMFMYGGFEGAQIADAQHENVSVHMTDGHEINGVFVYRFSSGVAVRYIGGTSIYFLPESEISDIELLSNG
jgi:hypothetical protein